MTTQPAPAPAPAIARQCLSCPWRVDCVPERDIPHGYNAKMHEALRDRTIRSGLDSLFGSRITAMACHHSKIGEEFVCAGWLHNQLGVGNNLAVRIAVSSGRLPRPEIDGDQHESFEDTLPKKRRNKTTKTTKTATKRKPRKTP